MANNQWGARPDWRRSPASAGTVADMREAGLRSVPPSFLALAALQAASAPSEDVHVDVLGPVPAESGDRILARLLAGDPVSAAAYAAADIASSTRLRQRTRVEEITIRELEELELTDLIERSPSSARNLSRAYARLRREVNGDRSPHGESDHSALVPWREPGDAELCIEVEARRLHLETVDPATSSQVHEPHPSSEALRASLEEQRREDVSAFGADPWLTSFAEGLAVGSYPHGKARDAAHRAAWRRLGEQLRNAEATRPSAWWRLSQTVRRGYRAGQASADGRELPPVRHAKPSVPPNHGGHRTLRRLPPQRQTTETQTAYGRLGTALAFASAAVRPAQKRRAEWHLDQARKGLVEAKRAAEARRQEDAKRVLLAPLPVRPQKRPGGNVLLLG